MSHPNLEESTRPLKRQRSTPTTDMSCDNDAMMLDDARTIKLQHLPFEAMKLIIHHLRTQDKALMSRQTSQVEGPESVTSRDLEGIVPLRQLCRLLRDAIDAHVVSLNLSNDTSERIGAMLGTCMLRYSRLTNLTITDAALDVSLLPLWAAFFNSSQARIRHLTCIACACEEPMSVLLAQACSHSLETISTSLMGILSAVTAHCGNVHSVKLLMSQVDLGILARLSNLRSVELFYPRGMSQQDAAYLVASLQRCRLVASVELGLYHVKENIYSWLTHLPGLRKLSLFDCTTQRGVHWIVKCEHLEEVHLEWMDELVSADVETIGMGLGSRLRKVGISNCRLLTDEALMALAKHCPRVELEVQFERDQFKAQTLALFGDRISWGSCAM